jgi:hypothetical protein
MPSFLSAKVNQVIDCALSLEVTHSETAAAAREKALSSSLRKQRATFSAQTVNLATCNS